MEPLATLAAGTIAKLAFDEFVKAGAGEAAKRSVGGAIELVKNLRGKIRAKFQGDAKAEKAIQAIEADGSQPALAELETYLKDAMDEDKTFATEIRQMVQQIINIQNQAIHGSQTYNNYGRDQNIINQPQGEIRIGG
ncbi:MAG: hypothetical protein EDM05_62800 [Leptolyngbya sp. IPPAS B-1204]|nr:MAG: hypothetical protein EDM05_26925 [Leptolyngbya sp. IPPAS B-1204]